MRVKKTKEMQVDLVDDQLTLECDLGGHYMTITYLVMYGKRVDAWLSIKAMPRTFWERIKLAWEALTSKKPFEVNDMCLNHFGKAEKLRDFCNKIIEVRDAYEKRFKKSAKSKKGDNKCK